MQLRLCTEFCSEDLPSEDGFMFSHKSSVVFCCVLFSNVQVYTSLFLCEIVLLFRIKRKGQMQFTKGIVYEHSGEYA